MLTPDEIVNYSLKQAVRGYSVPQVDDLLDQVADTIERLQARLDECERQRQRAEERLASASETESTLKRTLVTAQRAAEQSLEEAKERASQLVDDARREAAAMVEQARLEAEELRVESVQAARAEEAEIRRRRQELEANIEALRQFERDYRTRMREQLDEQLRLLEEGPPRPEVPEQRPLTVRVRGTDEREGPDTEGSLASRPATPPSDETGMPDG